MQPLTPLHYFKVIHGDGSHRAAYGGARYVTDCRRFIIFKSYGKEYQWKIASTTVESVGWLKSQGLLGETFPSRKQALAALKMTLEQSPMGRDS